MKRIEKPWGYEIIWAETNDYVAKVLHINKGHRLSKQYHEIKEETVYIVEGNLYNIDDKENIQKFLPGESFHVFPNQVHRFCANDSSVTLVEVSTPHLNDVVRMEDDYSRLD
jgi:quercetin dioxygenase-like cupin family protein